MQRVFSAVKAFIIKDNKFLILRHVINGIDDWALPGGKVEYGEDPYDTLKREVKEETNLDIKIIRPVGLYYFFRIIDKDQVICDTFLCEILNDGIIDIGKNPAEDNIQEFKWVSKEEFLKGNYQISHPSLKGLIEIL